MCLKFQIAPCNRKRHSPHISASQALAGQVCLHFSAFAYCMSLQDAFHYCVVTSSWPVGPLLCPGIHSLRTGHSGPDVYRQSYQKGMASVLSSKELNDRRKLIPSSRGSFMEQLIYFLTCSTQTPRHWMFSHSSEVSLSVWSLLRSRK